MRQRERESCTGTDVRCISTRLECLEAEPALYLCSASDFDLRRRRPSFTWVLLCPVGQFRARPRRRLLSSNSEEEREYLGSPVQPYYNSAELYTVAPSVSPSSLFQLHPKLKRVLRKSFSLSLHSLKPRYPEIRQTTPSPASTPPPPPPRHRLFH